MSVAAWGREPPADELVAILHRCSVTSEAFLRNQTDLHRIRPSSVSSTCSTERYVPRTCPLLGATSSTGICTTKKALLPGALSGRSFVKMSSAKSRLLDIGGVLYRMSQTGDICLSEAHHNKAAIVPPYLQPDLRERS